MKKALLLLAVVLLLVAPACSENATKNYAEIPYREGVYDYTSWDETTGTYTEDVLPDRETAVAVATQIFDGMNKSPSAQEYTPQSVFYDEQNAVWIVSFWQESDDKTVVGSDCSIALQKKDGRVLRIWFGE